MSRMSLKKRMFRSNMMILFLTLSSLMVIVLVVIAIFEEALKKNFDSMSSAKLNENVYQVIELMNEQASLDTNASIDALTALSDQVQVYGYQLIVFRDGQLVFGEDNNRTQDILKDFDQDMSHHAAGVTEVYYHETTTSVGFYQQSTDSYVLAANFAQQEWWIGAFQDSFTAFFIAFIVIVAAAVIVLLALSSYFTKKLSKTVMKPLDELVAGAKRIQSGNLTQEIVYQGDEEFENVCQTFNAMQRTMMIDREQRLTDERARIDMVTGISHDLRTPLTTIRGYIKGVLDGVADTEEKRKVYFQTAYEATGEMNVLLQKLFDFSRLESGQMPFQMVKGDLAEFTASYVAQKELVMDLKTVVISLKKDAEVLPDIAMDIEQIRRIFDNLLENSMKYVEAVPVRIRIHVYEKNSSVILDWSDNGQGVPKEKIDHIFDRFYRCDESRTQKGSGVGLYVVKYIMEQHAGSVSAHNEPGGGLLIRLCFPKGDAKE